jgi:hypothetical protein
METLLINVVNGSWVAEVANTTISYTFAGADLDAQAVNVQALADAMQAGVQTVNDAVAQIFAGIAPGNDDFWVTLSLFSNTSELEMGGESIYVCVQQDSLLDELVDAGLALAEAL